MAHDGCATCAELDQPIPHAIITSNGDFGSCSFVAVPVADWQIEGLDVVQRCRKPTAYVSQSNVNHGWGELCIEHAAHTRSCPRCSHFTATMKTASAAAQQRGC